MNFLNRMSDKLQSPETIKCNKLQEQKNENIARDNKKMILLITLHAQKT